MGRIPRVAVIGSVVIGAMAAPGVAHAAKFIDGVTAGEITASSAIVWGQTNKPAEVTAQVATDARFKQVVSTRSLSAKKSDDNTFQTKAKKLKAATTYRYRFCINKSCSDTGSFETAPKSNSGATIRFAYSADESGVAAPGQTDPFFGNMAVWRSVVAERNDFNVDLGDTIYSDPEVPNFPPALTVPEKWSMYRAKLAQLNMRKARSTAGMYDQWDDHEFINDFNLTQAGPDIYNAGVDAFRDYMPITYSKQTGIYRTFRWGKNLQIFFLDERSFRSAEADDNGACDNGGSPDLAPTAPQSTRNTFSSLVPALSTPPPQACLDLINSPDRTMLGSTQYQKFLADVKASTAKWKVIMNEVPIQQFYALPYDRWEGYAYERVQLLNDLQSANISNLVFLTTDVHASLANVVRYRTLNGDSAPSNAPAGPTDSPYQDFTTGPVATKTFAQEIDDTTGKPGNGKLVAQTFFSASPPTGVGMSCAQVDAYSYAEVTVSGSQLKLEYKDQNGDPLTSVSGNPCGPYTLQSSG